MQTGRTDTDTEGLQRAAAVRDQLFSLAGGGPLIAAISEGDPGMGAILFRVGIDRLRKMSDRPSLASFTALTQQATPLADKIRKGMAWLEEVQAKLNDPRVSYTDEERTALQAKAVARSETVGGWLTELDQLEARQVECWTHYLQNHPEGRMTIEKRDGSGKRVTFSTRALQGHPYPVWTPRHICTALRVALALEPERVDIYRDPLGFVADYCDTDPILAVKLTPADKAKIRQAAKERAGGSAALFTPTNQPAKQEGFGKL